MKLTKSEALAQGYTKCGQVTDGFGLLHDINRLNEVDFLEDGPFFLAEKEPYYTPSMNSEDIAELLADNIWSWNGDETGDDTDDVYDIVKALDYSAVAVMINEALKDKKYYKLTKIELVSDEQSLNK